MNELYTSLMQGTDKVLVNPKVITISLSIIVGLFGYYQINKDEATELFRERQLDKMDAAIATTGGLITEIAVLKTEVVYIKESNQRKEESQKKIIKQISTIQKTLKDQCVIMGKYWQGHGGCDSD